MIFENPINKKVKKLEEQLHGNTNEISIEKSENNNEEIISLNEILNTQSNKVDIEYIDSPLSGTITNVPRNLNFSFDEIGKLTIKYENYFDSINKHI